MTERSWHVASVPISDTRLMFVISADAFTGCLYKCTPIHIASLCQDDYFRRWYRDSAMTRTEWDFETTIDSDPRDVLWRQSPEDLADQFGMRTSLLLLCIAFVIPALWFVSSPSVEKCSAIENITDRNACYEALRKELLKPPAKGADIPKAEFRSARRMPCAR